MGMEERIRLENSLLLFYTGQSRKANDILVRQREASRKKTGATLEALHRVKAMVPQVQRCLEAGDMEGFGAFLHENWLQKKCFTTGVSNSRIDECYDLARRAGAFGGKITGAGGGGFLLLSCDPKYRQAVTRALEERGMIRLGFHLDDLGARVVANSGLRLTTHVKWQEPQKLFRKII